jgi:hypothetical protein
MDETGSRLLILGLIVIGFMLFNHFAQQAARRMRERQEAAARAAADAAAAQEEEAVLEDIWGRPVPPPRPLVPIETAPAPRAGPAAPPPARAAHPLFRTPQDLRRAIVVMTVLGPCRALEPVDRR